jgi:hypothetical protein
MPMTKRKKIISKTKNPTDFSAGLFDIALDRTPS